MTTSTAIQSWRLEQALENLSDEAAGALVARAEYALPSVPSSVSRTDAARWTGLPMVDDLGAKGDNSTNDTTALNAALATGIPHALRPGGIYRFAAALTPASGGGFVCPYGKATLRRTADNVHGFHIAASAARSNIILQGFKLDGVVASYTSANHFGIYVPGGFSVTDLKIFDVEVVDWASAGIILLGTSGARNSRITIRGGRVDNVGAHGIVAQTCCDDVLVEGVHVSRVARTVSDRPGITIGRASYRGIVRGCIVLGDGAEQGTSSHGISVEGDQAAGSGYGGTVMSCNVEGFKGYGIECSSSVAAIVGNNVKSCGGQAVSSIVVTRVGVENTPRKYILIAANNVQDAFGGIYVKGASGTVHEEILITDNNLCGDPDAAGTGGTGGVFVEYGKEVAILNNRIKDFKRSGIYIDHSNEVMVAQNMVKGCNVSASGLHAGIRWVHLTGETGRYLGPNLVKGSGVADYNLTTDGSTWAGSEWYGVAGLPTSSAGLASKQWWLNSGVLTQVA
jgi:nitrous oxidase accessory protein NosD